MATDVIKEVYWDVIATNRDRCFTGGDYDYGRTLYRNIETGLIEAERHWTSADFEYCPVYGGFGCSHGYLDAECHVALWETIDSLHVLFTVEMLPTTRKD
jgi:hypothetical protein